MLNKSYDNKQTINAKNVPCVRLAYVTHEALGITSEHFCNVQINKNLELVIIN
jgi:hypothetical protein